MSVLPGSGDVAELPAALEVRTREAGSEQRLPAPGCVREMVSPGPPCSQCWGDRLPPL